MTDINATTGSVDFGQVILGSAATLTFSITNIGEAVTTGPIQLGFTSSVPWAQVTSQACAALAPNASCTATVTTLPANMTAGNTYGDLTTQVLQAADTTTTHTTVSSNTYALKANDVNTAQVLLTPAAGTFATST